MGAWEESPEALHLLGLLSKNITYTPRPPGPGTQVQLCQWSEGDGAVLISCHPGDCLGHTCQSGEPCNLGNNGAGTH